MHLINLFCYCYNNFHSLNYLVLFLYNFHFLPSIVQPYPKHNYQPIDLLLLYYFYTYQLILSQHLLVIYNSNFDYFSYLLVYIDLYFSCYLFHIQLHLYQHKMVHYLALPLHILLYKIHHKYQHLMFFHHHLTKNLLLVNKYRFRCYLFLIGNLYTTIVCYYNYPSKFQLNHFFLHILHLYPHYKVPKQIDFHLQNCYHHLHIYQILQVLLMVFLSHNKIRLVQQPSSMYHFLL